MRTWVLACVTAAAVACGSSDGTAGTAIVVETVGNVYSGNPGWLIRASDGVFYAPRDLPEAFAVVGARVHVSLVVLPGLAQDQAVPAGIVHIEVASCDGFVWWSGATARIRVVDASTSGPVQGVTMTNADAPEQPVVGPGSCVAGVGDTECIIDLDLGWMPGIHVLEVSAPGYQTAQATFNLLPKQHPPGDCGVALVEPLWDPVYVSLWPGG